MKRVGVLPVRFHLSWRSMISVQEQQHNEIIYLAALSVLRKLCFDGGITVEIAERINQKNAEKMGCIPVAIK